MIENAIKFAPQSSDISIELQANDNRIVFTIVNGGKPIPPHQLPYIFNKFYQGDTPPILGNGIGLGPSSSGLSSSITEQSVAAVMRILALSSRLPYRLPKRGWRNANLTNA